MRKSSIKKIFPILLLIFFVFAISTEASAKSNIFSFVMNGYNGGENDRSLVYNRLYFNNLSGVNSKTHLNVFHYDQETKGAGTTKDSLNALISNSMEGATKNDIFLFYYSGHSASLSGFSLAGYKEGSTIYYSDQYLFSDLAKELSKFPGKIVVILDCCHAENFYTEGVKKLSGNLGQKFYCLLACGSEQESQEKKYIVWETPKVSVSQKSYGRFTKTIGLGLGYWEGKLQADKNNDGIITFRELGQYVQKNIGTSKMSVKYYSYNNADINLFGYPTYLSKTNLSLKVSKSIQLKALYSDDLIANKVTWSSSNKSVASVSSNGTVKAKKSGTAIITATANGTSATCKVTVVNSSSKASIKLNKSTATIYTSGAKTAQLKATVSGESKKITWKSSKPSVATVDSKGKVTAKKAGTTTITARANGKTAKCKVIVKKPTIKLNKTKATIYTTGTKTVKLNATVKGLSSKVAWKASDKSVATVNSKGKVTAQKAGTVTITAKANGVTAKCKITVKKKSDTTSTNWKKLYKSFLSQKSTVVSGNGSSRTVTLSSAYFTVGDINNDGIKELFVREDKDAYGNMTSTVSVFTIINGKVSWAGDLWNVGDAPEISKKYGGVHYTWYATGCAHFYFASIKNGKLYMKADITRYSEPSGSYYYVNGKEVSKATFDKTLKSYEDSLVKVEKFAINNAFNREWTFG